MNVELLISCEHASNAVPEGLELGVGREALESHVAWDHGAAEIARALASSTGAPLYLGSYARLVVDLNRREENPGVIPPVSFGEPVPGNWGLTDDQREDRLARFHRPYRAAVLAEARRIIERGRRCFHVLCHSFTPRLGSEVRDYDLGILFDPSWPLEEAAAESLLHGLRRAGFDARANQPYLGTDDGVATWLREFFPKSSYGGVEIEVSHAVTERPGGLDAVIGLLRGLIPETLGRLREVPPAFEG